MGDVLMATSSRARLLLNRFSRAPAAVGGRCARRSIAPPQLPSLARQGKMLRGVNPAD